MTMETLVIGVDGGGSKTRALVADERGEQIAEAVGGASAVKPGEIEHSAEVIAGVVRDVLETAEKSGAKPRVLSVGVAGLRREPEREALLEALVGRQLAEEVSVLPDYAIALEDA